MRRTVLVLIVFGILLALALVANVRAQQEESIPAKRDFSLAVVCSDLQSALSLRKAFNRGSKEGWERLAIDRGRSKRYRSNHEAINAGVCLFKFMIVGRVMQTHMIRDVKYYVLEDTEAYLPSYGFLLKNKTIYIGSTTVFLIFTLPPQSLLTAW